MTSESEATISYVHKLDGTIRFSALHCLSIWCGYLALNVRLKLVFDPSVRLPRSVNRLTVVITKNYILLLAPWKDGIRPHKLQVSCPKQYQNYRGQSEEIILIS